MYLHLRAFYEELSLHIVDLESYIVEKVKINERLKLHTDNVYAFLVALVEEDYFFKKSKHFEMFNYTTIEVVPTNQNKVLSAPKLKGSPIYEVCFR